jgi:hypothetical protein
MNNRTVSWCAMAGDATVKKQPARCSKKIKESHVNQINPSR